jgi:hypothetical protein
MSQRSASRSCVLALSWHPDVAGCESAGGQCSPTTMSPRPERRDARELRRLDGEGRGARGAEPLVCPPGDDVSLASAMSLPPMSSSSLRRWAEPGEIGEATALPGRGPRALAREGIPGRAGKASLARSDQGLDDDDPHAAALTDALRCSRSSCMFKERAPFCHSSCASAPNALTRRRQAAVLVRQHPHQPRPAFEFLVESLEEVRAAKMLSMMLGKPGEAEGHGAASCCAVSPSPSPH